MNISLSEIKAKEEKYTIGISEDTDKLIETKEILFGEGGLKIDNVFITRQILDIVPNPWVAFDMAKKVIDIFLKKYDEQILANNLVFIIDELRKHLEKESDRLAESVFREQISKKAMFFFLLHGKGGYELPSRINVKKNSKPLIRNDYTSLQRSLFEFVEEEKFNDTEKAVALYLDEQEKLLWWYRNISRQDYYLQGWKKNKIYPDFIFSEIDSNVQDDYSKVFVVETKGIHLKNEDTDYKKDIFEFCNKLGIQKNWTELNTEFDQKIEFQVIFEDEWKAKINKIFGV